MTESTVSAAQAIQNSQSAFKRGDKLSARRWAEKAAALSPELEEPWLLLAALANPQASVNYLKQALKINPESLRAKAGLDWAQKRLDSVTQTKRTAAVRAAKPISAAPRKSICSSESIKKTRKSIYLFLLPLLFLGVLAFSIWTPSPVMAFFTSQFKAPLQGHAPAWVQVEISKPTMTLSPTATLTATPNPTSTPEFTATPSETPVPTDTPIPPEALAVLAAPETDASPTPLPTDTAVAVPTSLPAQAQAATSSYSGGKWILVDISEQHLWAYEGEAVTYSFIASTGMHNGTAVGTFHILDKIPNAYGSTWDIWMPNWMGIYYSGSLENGIHALPIMPDGSQLWDGYLGTPISYGCVVLSAYDSQLLYNWAEVGIPVVIQR